MSADQFEMEDREQWVRDRLAEAGETITVAPAAPPTKSSPPAWVVPAVAAAAVTGIVAGSLAWWHGTSAEPDRPIDTPSVSPAPTSSSELVAVPALVGLVKGKATRILEGSGLAVEVRATAGSCATPVVLAQRPANGTKVEGGTQVRLEVGCPNDPDDELSAIASRFASAAHSRKVNLPIDTPVGLYLGGHHVTDISAGEAARWEAWNICVDGYAARVCPFNALELVAGSDDVSISTETPKHSCAHWPGRPAELEAYRAVSLTVGSDCVSWGAVTLYVNDMGQIVAVDQIVAEP
ncbi:MAG: hypothetical protein QM655_03920 [Nocardioidaceae bacterium]